MVTRAPRTPPGPSKPPVSPKHLARYWHAPQQRGVVKTARNRLRVTMTGSFRSVFLRAFFFFFYWLLLVLAGWLLVLV